VCSSDLNRGRYLVYLEAFWALGALAAAGFAWLIVPRIGWRWLLAVSAVPGIIIIFIRRYIPESPRYLLVRGKNNEALEVLRKVAGENGVSIADVSALTEVETKPTEIKDIWRPAIRKTTFLLWSIWFFISLGYYGIFTWLPNYLRSGGMQLLPVYQNSFILALAQLPGYFSAAFLVEKLGRRKTLTIYLMASALFTFLFAAATNLTWVIVLGIWMSFFTLGAWGVIYAYTPEVYPTVLRSTGMGAASGMTRIAGALAPLLGGLLLGSGLGFPLAIFSAAYLIAGISAWFLPRETRAIPMDDTL
jgi:putative MFS transporter